MPGMLSAEKNFAGLKPAAARQPEHDRDLCAVRKVGAVADQHRAVPVPQPARGAVRSCDDRPSRCRRAIRASAARYISGSASPWISTPPSRWVIAGSGFSFTSCLSRYASRGGVGRGRGVIPWGRYALLIQMDCQTLRQPGQSPGMCRCQWPRLRRHRRCTARWANFWRTCFGVRMRQSAPQSSGSVASARATLLHLRRPAA